MNWSKTEVNHIRVSLGRCNAQQLADELGTAKSIVESKIQELEAKDKLAKLSMHVRRNKD